MKRFLVSKTKDGFNLIVKNDNGSTATYLFESTSFRVALKILQIATGNTETVVGNVDYYKANVIDKVRDLQEITQRDVIHWLSHQGLELGYPSTEEAK